MFPAGMRETIGVSQPNPTTLLSAFPIKNNGRARAENVQVTSIALNGGVLMFPKSLPINLGTIPVGSTVVLNADFSGGPFTAGGRYALTVNGTYNVKAETFCFALNGMLNVPPRCAGVCKCKDKISAATFREGR